MLDSYRSAIQNALVERQAWRTPPIAWPVVAMAALIAVTALVGYLKSPAGHESRHFVEGGLVTALSSVLLGMAAGLSGTAFFLSRRQPRLSGYFWLLTAFGFGFFAIDELLQFHEYFGRRLSAMGYATPAGFRNWNDLIVIGYGFVALCVIIPFLPEILRVPKFAMLLATACGFYVMHTAIDSICARSNTSIIIEETAKLYSGGFFALSFFAAIVAFAAQDQATD